MKTAEVKAIMTLKDGFDDKHVKRQITLSGYRHKLYLERHSLTVKLLDLRDKIAQKRFNERVDLIRQTIVKRY